MISATNETAISTAAVRAAAPYSIACTESYTDIDAVRVRPGMFPQTTSTTPTWPSVGAKVTAAAPTTPGIESLSTTRQNVRHREAPRHQAASIRRRLTPVNEAIIGCTAKGRL